MRAKTLADYLSKNQLSQTALARTLGISLGHLNDIKSGRRTPSLALALKIRDATGVPLESLIGRAA